MPITTMASFGETQNQYQWTTIRLYDNILLFSTTPNDAQNHRSQTKPKSGGIQLGQPSKKGNFDSLESIYIIKINFLQLLLT